MRSARDGVVYREIPRFVCLRTLWHLVGKWMLMSTEPAEPSEQSDQHAGAESVQEVGLGPARLNALDERVSNLYDCHARALTAMQRADFHLARAARMLTHAITTRSRLT